MPRPVLKIVAILVGLCAIVGFVLGLQATPEKGRLPGESATGQTAAPLDAPDAQPLADDMPPPPPPEDKKKPEDDAKKDEVDPNDAAAPMVTPPPPAATPAKPAPAEDRVGDLLDGVTPPPQEDPPQ